MAMSTSPTGSESAAADGPVLSLMSKRLRALRKKYNRILQMEASLAQGKTLNKEQEEVLRSKPGVIALIDEYEKLRSPLAAAVQEEIARAAFSFSSDNHGNTPEAADESSSSADSSVKDLLALLYFGCLFDVKPQSDFASTMLTRTHERGCCLTYDYVTDDATELLGEKDLDMISALAGLVTSRPLYSGISHRSALQGCLQHAKLWLQGAHQPIVVGSSVTYDSLRVKLNKILDSDYYTTTPEMKAPVDVAAAVGKYNAACQVQVSEASDEPARDAPSDDVLIHYHQQEDKQEDNHDREVTPDLPSPGHDLQRDEEDESVPTGAEITAMQNEQLTAEADTVEHKQRDYELNDQQHVPRRLYQNQRGGGRRGGGRSQKGYSNSNNTRGRNAWGGNGGYENGRNQYYDHGYHPRNYYNPRLGRGGRGGGSAMYNYHGASGHGSTHGHGPSNVELGASA
ncbi:hypothetical protein IEQ34_011958 [Dendrobium chrysotoxum]|uniref:Glycine-rich protein n=1 Tax=Dendrobium chrysotoxum TaxID=161865 RepID=A0AAV7GTR5_DENCH|nr:hypothetical protein IEQ34_011958 [Dendrobium chrysotoxum]